jgi:hypothetical protein
MTSLHYGLRVKEMGERAKKFASRQCHALTDHPMGLPTKLTLPAILATSVLSAVAMGLDSCHFSYKSTYLRNAPSIAQAFDAPEISEVSASALPEALRGDTGTATKLRGPHEPVVDSREYSTKPTSSRPTEVVDGEPHVRAFTEGLVSASTIEQRCRLEAIARTQVSLGSTDMRLTNRVLAAHSSNGEKFAECRSPERLVKSGALLPAVGAVGSMAVLACTYILGLVGLGVSAVQKRFSGASGQGSTTGTQG